MDEKRTCFEIHGWISMFISWMKKEHVLKSMERFHCSFFERLR